MDDFTVKHLEFLQGIITRMGTNSFLIRGWMITLVSALFALAAKDTDKRYIIVILIAVPAFWLLDAFYLSQELQYRALYDVVRERSSTDFSMDAKPYNKGKNKWFASLFSTTMGVLYLPVFVITVLVVLFVN